jgi:hypothetical protein
VEGDDEHRRRQEPADAGEQACGRHGVDSLRRLIEQEHVRPPQQPLRHAEPAALATREGGAVGAGGGVERQRQRSRSQRLLELAVGGGGGGEQKILADRPVEDMSVLGDERDVSHEVGALDRGGRRPGKKRLHTRNRLAGDRP